MIRATLLRKDSNGSIKAQKPGTTVKRIVLGMVALNIYNEKRLFSFKSIDNEMKILNENSNIFKIE
jgi:hypothetical protein